MTTRLQEEYERLAVRVPDHADADRAIRTARRRRASRATAVVVAVAAVGAALTATWPPGGDAVGPVGTPTPATATEWFPEPDTDGAPAPAGTLIYRTCPGSECLVLLGRPEQSSLKLSDLRPDLAQRLARQGLDGVSLSPDAKWLGVPVGTGFELHKLSNDNVSYRVDPGPPGTHWRIIDWNRNAYLAQYVGSRVTAFKAVDLEGTTVSDYRLPPDYRKLPVGLGLDITVALPVEPSTRLDQISVWNIAIAPDPISGGARRQGEDPVQLQTSWKEYLGPDETLAGPLGVPVESEVPRDREGENYGSAVTVFADHSGARVPVAVLLSYDAKTRRVEIPGTLLGPIDGQSIAVLRPVPNEELVDVVQIKAEGAPRLLHRLPKDAQVLIPG